MGINILTYTTLYPNAAQPHHGIFVEQRLRRLVGSGDIGARVVAPVPWFPVSAAWAGRYARYARVPAREERHGIEMYHPRYLTIPKIGMTAAPWLLALASLRALRRAVDAFDLIDAHYFYPDGAAAALLGQWLSKPVVITARGTDVNLIGQYALPRRMIRWAAARSAGVIAVCQALKDRLIELGAEPANITVLRNGVDLSLFRPLDRGVARSQLGLRRRTLLSVGSLLRSKGHDVAIEALVSLPDTDLVIVGEGPERGAFEKLAAARGLSERVRFAGSIAQEELARYYSAADALVLPSVREGWTNVLLEAMACGTPVVASRVGGTPEIVRAPQAGILVEERTAAAFVSALRQLFEHYPDRAATRRYAEEFGWDETVRRQIALYRRIVEARR